MRGFYFVALPLAFPDDDPLAPRGAAAGAGRVTCDFCACELAADGNVLRMSSRAKDLAKIEARLEKAADEVATAKARLAELEQELAAAKAAMTARPAPAGASSVFDLG